jgi:hypothetical protein
MNSEFVGGKRVDGKGANRKGVGGEGVGGEGVGGERANEDRLSAETRRPRASHVAATVDHNHPGETDGSAKCAEFPSTRRALHRICARLQ